MLGLYIPMKWSSSQDKYTKDCWENPQKSSEIQLPELRLVSLIKIQLRHHMGSYEEKDFIRLGISMRPKSRLIMGDFLGSVITHLKWQDTGYVPCGLLRFEATKYILFKLFDLYRLLYSFMIAANNYLLPV